MTGVRRLPGLYKLIKDISKEDVRVRVVGRVVDKKDNIIVIDDGTGSVTVRVSDAADLEGVIRVIGRVMATEDGIELEGEVVQSAEGLDIEAYRNAYKIFSSV